jgi:ribulose-phosphate 3-epimerase
MTVNSGFGYQHFIHSTLGKINRVRRLIDSIKPQCDLEVDGGIDPETARFCAEAGANVLVSGSTIFGNSSGVMTAMEQLRAVQPVEV